MNQNKIFVNELEISHNIIKQYEKAFAIMSQKIMS